MRARPALSPNGRLYILYDWRREGASEQQAVNHFIKNVRLEWDASTPCVVSQRPPLQLYGLYSLYGWQREGASEQQATVF